MFVSRIIRVRRRDRVIRGCTDGLLPPSPTRSCFRRKVVVRDSRREQRPLTGLRKRAHTQSSHLTKDTRHATTKRECPPPYAHAPQLAHTLEIISGVPRAKTRERST